MRVRTHGRLRVALVATHAPDRPGSMAAYAETLADALARHAPEVDVVLAPLDAESANGRWASRWRTLTLPWRARALRALQPDVWHVLDGSRAYLSPGLGPKPIVVTVHDVIPALQMQGRFTGVATPGIASRWLWKRNGAALRKATALACVSRCTRADAHHLFATPGTADVVPNPLRSALAALVDDDAHDDWRDAGMLLHVGNNAFYKHRAQVLRTFAALDPALARRLVMVGARPTAELLELAATLRLSERVHWVEDVDEQRLVEHYRRASVLLFPSLYEGYGWPVLEAMAFGLPVVCSDRGSLPEVAGDAAVVVPADDTAAQAQAVERLLRDPVQAAALAARGLLRAREFDARRFARAMADLYRQAADAAGPTR
jgi:glycosyltransferase involved in cell wall biosynthesis